LTKQQIFNYRLKVFKLVTDSTLLTSECHNNGRH